MHTRSYHHGNQIEVHHTTIGGRCCRRDDRRRASGRRNGSAVLQREQLGDVCQSTGNVQIKTNAPNVQFHPYGDQARLLFND